MLQRTFTRSLRQYATENPLTTCTLCSCSCGRILHRNGLPIQQKRFREPRPNQLPYAQRLKLREQEQEKANRERQNVDLTRYRTNLTWMEGEGQLRNSVDNALAFLEGFDQLVEQRKGAKRSEGIGADPKQLEWLMHQTTMEAEDITLLSKMLVVDPRDAEHRLLGKKMMYSLAGMGNILAMSEIMQSVLLEARTRPRVLQSSDLAPLRKQIALLAQGGPDQEPDGVLFARITEGRVQYVLGDVDRAIKLWTEAVQSFSADTNLPLMQEAVSHYSTDFPPPWVELAKACLLRGDLQKAKWAIDFGCKLDDPHSHYTAAVFEMNENRHGEYVATSDWLYHMTKAAGAGHIKASHALGCWYVSSTWKYIADEPPDSVKPTPFDSYPPDSGLQAPTTSFWDRLGGTLGLYPQQASNPKDSVFHLAAFPNTPSERMNIAMQWLQVGIAMMYAPSYLATARLLLQKTLSPSAAASKNALELADERYIYASQADFKAGIVVANSQQRTTESEEQAIPNPAYDPERAKDLVRQIFFAKGALKIRQKRLELPRSRSAKTSTSESDKARTEQTMLENAPEDIKKWFRFPEVQEMFMDDSKERLWDENLAVDLEVEARKICDEREWDLFDEDGGLMYKHGGGRR